MRRLKAQSSHYYVSVSTSLVHYAMTVPHLSTALHSSGALQLCCVQQTHKMTAACIMQYYVHVSTAGVCLLVPHVWWHHGQQASKLNVEYCTVQLFLSMAAGFADAKCNKTPCIAMANIPQHSSHQGFSQHLASCPFYHRRQSEC